MALKLYLVSSVLYYYKSITFVFYFAMKFYVFFQDISFQPLNELQYKPRLCVLFDCHPIQFIGIKCCSCGGNVVE